MDTTAPQDPRQFVGTTVPWEILRLDERRIAHLLDVSRLSSPPYVRGDDIGPLVPPTVLVAQRVSSERLGIPDAPAKLNGGNAFRWLADVAPGEVLERRSTIEDVTRKVGRTGLLDLYRVRTFYRRKADQQPVGEAQATTIRRYPTEQTPQTADRQPTNTVANPPGAVEVFSVTPSSRDLVRYSAATDDFYEAHYDLEFARAAGLPGVLVHGLLKMAYLATAAVRTAGAGTVVREISVSYRGTDLVHEPIRMLVEREGDRDGLTHSALHSVSADGRMSTTGHAALEKWNGVRGES